jgi:hypothetical protein
MASTNSGAIHPRELRTKEMEAFLTHLAMEKKVAPLDEA